MKNTVSEGTSFATVVTLAIVVSLVIGFIVGQNTSCFDFFGLWKGCTVHLGK